MASLSAEKGLTVTRGHRQHNSSVRRDTAHELALIGEAIKTLPLLYNIDAEYIVSDRTRIVPNLCDMGALRQRWFL